MDFLEDVLRNFESVTNCIRQNNIEFLSLHVPTLNENYHLFSQVVATNLYDNVNINGLLSQLVDIFRNLLDQAEDLIGRSSIERTFERIQLPLIRERLNGRPRIDIPAPQVNALRQCGATWTRIAKVFNVSRRTLTNRLQDNHIEDPRTSHVMSDEELFVAITAIKREFPSAGLRYVWGALKAQHLYVPRRLVQSHLRAIDPIGVLSRRRIRLRRRQYKVKGANSLWHIDGNEKIVNWGMWIHGCTDGFSRKVMYLEVCLTKQADVVLDIFIRGVTENGLPLRVRGDYGTENVRIVDFMQSSRSTVVSPFIPGKSVHNTRIERLWGEVNRIVTQRYRAVFKYLEENDVLSQLSLSDLLCLWYVYFPRIQNTLTYFKNCWNHHNLSTENNRCPHELWLTNLIEQSYENDVCSLRLVPEQVGFHSTFNREPFSSVLLRSNLDLDPELIHQISATFEELVPDPMVEDDQQGIQLYLNLRNHLSNE
nr:PREDICTED: uncharacterized protein LOC109033301 [Bemisia tabaci]